jgi:hypothetical protein
VEEPELDAQLSGSAQINNSLRPLMPETPLNSVPEDDWDHSLPDPKDNAATTSPAPAESSVQDIEGNPSLSKLLRLHSEKDSKANFSAEEAARIADVLGQWVGVHSCPVPKLDPDLV